MRLLAGKNTLYATPGAILVKGPSNAPFAEKDLLDSESRALYSLLRCLDRSPTFVISYRDVLNRHRTSHEQDREEPSDSTRSRACRQCATSRARCSRSDPCRRCFQRNLTCTFPTTRKSKAAAIMGTRTGIDSEPQDSSLGASHQTAETQAEVETSLLATGPAVPVNMNAFNSEGANGSHLSSRANAWNQQPAMFEISQGAGPIDHGAQRVYEFSSISGFNEQALDLLSMNWMSPEQSASLGWDGFVAVPPYAENDKNDLYLPFFFSNSGSLPDSGRQCVPPSIEHGNSLDSASVSTCALPKSKSRSEGIKSTAGSYYVDGDGSRAPFGGQATQNWRGRRMTGANNASTPGSNSTNYTDAEASRLWEDNLVSVESYESMIRHLHLELGKQNVVMDASTLLSLECIAHCVQSYFANFHSTFPFIRKAAFLEHSSNDWILLLAVAVVGSKYTSSDDEERLHVLSSEFMAALDSMAISRLCHGRLTEAIISSTPSLGEVGNGVFGLATLQAATLFLICSLHRGKADMTKRALLERHYLVGACKELKLLSGESVERHRNHGGGNIAQSWLKSQSHIRIGLMIWVRLERPEVYPLSPADVFCSCSMLWPRTSSIQLH